MQAAGLYMCETLGAMKPLRLLLVDVHVQYIYVSCTHIYTYAQYVLAMLCLL